MCFEALFSLTILVDELTSTCSSVFLLFDASCNGVIPWLGVNIILSPDNLLLECVIRNTVHNLFRSLFNMSCFMS